MDRRQKKVLMQKTTQKNTSGKLSLESSPVIHAHGIGFDIHKASIAVAISAQITNGEIIFLKSHTFKHDSVGLDEMCKFLHNFNINPTYLMECTGVYHLPVYRRLNAEFPAQTKRIIAMNPLLVHHRISDLGNKNDKADARSLSSLAFYHKILAPSYVGSVEFFSLRDLIRSYHKNCSRVNQQRNRIHRQLDVVNQKFPFELSTEWGLQLLDRYISKSWSLKEAYDSLLEELQLQNKGKVVKKHESDVLRSADIILTEEQRFLLQFDLLELLSAFKANAVLLTRAENYVVNNQTLKSNYAKLMQIPGFGAITALTVLTEIGDYNRFKSIDAFVKFCGVIPTIDQSGTHVSRGHINRFTNKHLRYVLCQAAGRLITLKSRSTDLGNYAYKQYVIKGETFKKSSVSVGNKMARTIYHVLTGKHNYNPAIDISKKRQNRIRKQLEKKQSALDSYYTRALRRDIKSFLVSHSELLNSTSKYHLVAGFQRLIRKSRYEDEKEDQSGRKRERIIRTSKK